MCDHLVNSSARLSGSMYRNSVNISVSIYVVERQQNYYGTKNLHIGRVLVEVKGLQIFWGYGIWKKGIAPYL